MTFALIHRYEHLFAAAVVIDMLFVGIEQKASRRDG